MTRFLIDTNLLVLLILGGSDQNLIGSHKRLRNFNLEDFKGLEMVLSDATGFVTLPYILAECSNLIGIGKNAPPAAVILFERFVRKADEIATKSEEVVQHQYFRSFGLTDSAIIYLVRDRVHVVTVDHALHGVLVDLGIRSTNLRHRTWLQ